MEKFPINKPIVPDERLGTEDNYRAQMLENRTWGNMYRARFGDDMKNYAQNTIGLFEEMGYELYYYRPYKSEKFKSVVMVGIDCPWDSEQFVEVQCNESQGRLQLLCELTGRGTIKYDEIGGRFKAEAVVDEQVEMPPRVLVIENDTVLPSNVRMALKYFEMLAPTSIFVNAHDMSLDAIQSALRNHTMLVCSPTLTETGQIHAFLACAMELARKGELALRDVYIVKPSQFQVSTEYRKDLLEISKVIKLNSFDPFDNKIEDVLQRSL